MSDSRRACLAVGFLLFGLGVIGVGTTVVGEYQARLALPPEMQTAQAIEMYFDGAACLSCGLLRNFCALIAFVGGAVALLSWPDSASGRQF